MKNKRGFTLVEIMIVVAIIALLATIALPGLLRTRTAANEAGAIAGLRSLATAQETFRATSTPIAYAASAFDLANATPPYVTGFTIGAADPITKSGYNFYCDNSRGTANTFTCMANSPNANTGNRNFCIDETGIMRAQAQTTAYVVTVACPTTTSAL